MAKQRFPPNFKWVILLIAVILILLGYFFKQKQTTNQMTQNSVSVGFPVTPEVSLANLHWVTYTNKHLEIMFQYPDNYAKVQEKQNSIFLVRGLSPVFSVNRIDTSLSPIDWWDSSATDRQKSGAPADQYILSNVTFKQMPALYFKDNFLAQVPTDFYAIQRNGFITTIYYATEGTESVQIGPSPNAQAIQRYRENVKQFQSYDKIIIQKILYSIVLN